MPIAVGSQAPDITLKSKTDAGLVDLKLGSSEKPTVLLFFPAAFTGVCTQELCDVSGGLYGFGPDVDVIGVSGDSPFAQEAWAKASKITIPLASDYSLVATKAYDVMLPDLVGLGPASARAAIVIDTAGVVQYAEQTATPLDLPNFAAIKETLASL